jgi:mRNA-degrading endonuclease RelE of RelBE toxin-antitoxin system
MRAFGEAIEALGTDPYPPPPVGVHHGEYHRLHVGEYRVFYRVDGDVVTIERVDHIL